MKFYKRINLERQSFWKCVDVLAFGFAAWLFDVFDMRMPRFMARFRGEVTRRYGWVMREWSIDEISMVGNPVDFEAIVESYRKMHTGPG